MQNSPQKIVIYGPGGIGKSELASLIEAVGIKPLFLDLESGTNHLAVNRIGDIQTWDEMRSVLQDAALTSQFGAVVVDSLTKAEELAIAWTLANVKHEKGHTVDSIEGYGFGKGLTHVYETFLQLLGDLDACARRGLHVICTAHECVSNAPNPTGEDWLRFEPRLQSPASGKNSIRHRVREWCDHQFFIGYDVIVSKDGKGTGSGTRAIYPNETPTQVAKSRTLSHPVVYQRGSALLWEQLFSKGE